MEYHVVSKKKQLYEYTSTGFLPPPQRKYCQRKYFFEVFPGSFISSS
jgi:hypothetical protein